MATELPEIPKLRREQYGWIELLEDDQGVYGLRLEDDTWDINIYYRPDRVGEMKGMTALQMIPLQTRASTAFRWTAEYALITAKRLAAYKGWSLSMDAHANLANPVLCEFKIENLTRKWKRAGTMVNQMVRTALQSAEPEFLRQARRFHVQYRTGIYKGLCADGQRAAQLIDTNALAALKVYGKGDLEEDLRSEARRMITIGAQLRDLERLLEIPKITRLIKPGAVDKAEEVLSSPDGDPDRIGQLLRNGFPKTVAQQKLWWRLVSQGFDWGWPSDYMDWFSRRTPELFGRRAPAERVFLGLADFARATLGADILPEGITAFNPSMSASRALVASEEWHTAVSTEEDDGSNITFPEPWLKGGRAGKFRITAVKNSSALKAAARELRNCLASFVKPVITGSCCIYLVRKDEKAVAAFELLRTAQGTFKIGQLSGKRNSKPSNEVQKVVRTWFMWTKKIRANHQMN